GTAFPPFAGRFKEKAEGILGIGGINVDDPKIKEYIDKHKAATGGNPPDYWASAMTYAGLQVLGQAIEAAGTKDKAAVIEAIKTGTFDTVMGEVKFDNNVNPNVYTTGQWQGGVFKAVAADGLTVGAEPMKKPAW